MGVIKRGSGHQYGERNGATKLTEAQVDEMRRLRTGGFQCQELAVKYNVSKSAVSRITRGVSWRKA